MCLILIQKTIMKKLYLFSIEQLLKLLELLRPLVELVMKVINVFKKKPEDEENK